MEMMAQTHFPDSITDYTENTQDGIIKKRTTQLLIKNGTTSTRSNGQ